MPNMVAKLIDHHHKAPDVNRLGTCDSQHEDTRAHGGIAVALCLCRLCRGLQATGVVQYVKVATMPSKHM